RSTLKETELVEVAEAVADSGPELAQRAQFRLAQALSDPPAMIRASLIRNDALMKSLGRPAREQIVSMRPSDLTTLEAINLSNGPALADALAEGSRSLLARFSDDPRGLTDHVFRFALSRSPSQEEWSVIQSTLGDQLTAEAVEDLLWAVCMMPEFMLV